MHSASGVFFEHVPHTEGIYPYAFSRSPPCVPVLSVHSHILSLGYRHTQALPTPQPLRPLPDMAELISSLCLCPKEWGSLAFVGQAHTRGVQSDPPGHPWTCSNHSAQPQQCWTFPSPTAASVILWNKDHGAVLYRAPPRASASLPLPRRAFPVSLLRSSCPQEHHCQSVHCSPLLLHGVKKGERGQGKKKRA